MAYPVPPKLPQFQILEIWEFHTLLLVFIAESAPFPFFEMLTNFSFTAASEQEVG